jgi:hypothetical protein
MEEGAAAKRGVSLGVKALAVTLGALGERSRGLLLLPERERVWLLRLLLLPVLLLLLLPVLLLLLLLLL